MPAKNICAGVQQQDLVHLLVEFPPVDAGQQRLRGHGDRVGHSHQHQGHRLAGAREEVRPTLYSDVAYLSPACGEI